MRQRNEWQQRQLERIAITFLISSLLVLRAAGVWAAEQPKPILISLPASYEVTNPSATVVTFGDVATKIVGGSEAEQKTLRAIPIMAAPQPGKFQVCSSAQMVAACRRAGFEGYRRFRFHGPRNITILGLGQTITKKTLTDKITQDITQDLEWDPKELSIRVLSFPKEIRVPLGDVRIQVRRTSPQRYGAVQYDLSVLINDEEFLHRKVIVAIAHRRDVFVFRNNKKAGTIVTLQDVDVQKRYVRSEREDQYMISKARELVGRKLARTVNRGVPVTRDLFAHTYLVSRGQVVRMIIRSGNIRMDIRGRSQQNGNVGDIIRVKNLFNKKIIRARVVSAQTVEMV